MIDTAIAESSTSAAGSEKSDVETKKRTTKSLIDTTTASVGWVKYKYCWV